jgi:hypothetical protein
MMNNVQKNFISFLLGCLFAYLSLWFSGIGSAAPIPDFIREYKTFVTYFYSTIVIVVAAGFVAYLVLLMVRKGFTLFTKQNFFCFALPIVLFVTSMLIFMGAVILPLLYATIPALSIFALLTKAQK